MPNVKRILVTGSNGYLGSVMAPWLSRAGYEVIGLDTKYFGDCTLVPDLLEVPTIEKDLREISASDLRDIDAVIHLAALSNDPIGNLNEGWTSDINCEASVRLAEMAREAGVRRFIFSSSCIMYGMSSAAVVDENSPLAPQTEYARSKVKAEEKIRELADDSFSPTFCRNGTVYGVSPRMRFDTVLNDLMASAYTTGRVEIMSDGTPWRPVVHVHDVARAFQTVLEAPREVIHNEAFNTGSADLNYQIRELGEIVANTVPGCELVFAGKPGADQRTYKAAFEKFSKAFPNFSFMWSPGEGARELYEAFRAIGLTKADYLDDKFTRLRWLRHLLDTGALDESLRWRVKANQAA